MSAEDRLFNLEQNFKNLSQDLNNVKQNVNIINNKLSTIESYGPKIDELLKICSNLSSNNIENKKLIHSQINLKNQSHKDSLVNLNTVKVY